ncbi:MAG TPA: methionine synthase [Candidatus Binatia bacterium]|nr:methionine synthase [Candidatus Binatia bacterium]
MDSTPPSHALPSPRSGYLGALDERVLVFDGAMGTALQAFEPTAEQFGGPRLEGWIDGLVLHSPDLVERVHRAYLESGADVIETCTFQSTPIRHREWGAEGRTEELNESAAKLARRLADEHSTADQPRFVAGSMGPSGYLPASSDPSLGAISFRDLAGAFRTQACGLLAGGVDLLIIETGQDILEMKAAVFGAREAMARVGRTVPIQAQASLDVSGRMLLGTDIAAVLTILEGLRVDVVGLNCGTGPDYMGEPLRYLAEHTRLPISCIPNAGLPINVGGRAHYPMLPVPLAEQLASFVRDLRINVVGGCCGTTPAHIGEVVARVRGLPATARAPEERPRLASSIRAIELHQEPRPLLIGERVNAQGSRRIKEMLLADDYEGILRVAKGQVEGGAHSLDVCVALTERADEAGQMAATVKTLQQAVEVPLCIDSTEAEVIRVALESYPGRGIVNSINMESGRARCDAVLPLVRDHGQAVIALTIDERGMAKTRERKLEVARQIRDIACGEYGLAAHQLIFDDLTFTLATGDPDLADSALETLEGIRLIKRELPGVLTSLGVSNVSFGLTPPARAVLNSVFLHHAVEAGLDAAIVNPAHTVPYAEVGEQRRELAEDLIFNRREDALARYIEHFAGVTERVGAEKVDPFAGMAAPERIHAQILHRRKEGIEALIDEALRDRDPVAVLNDILLPAMKDVGDRFGAGELILPFVLQSAEVMKRAVAHLEQHLDRSEGHAKGQVVLATVFGDVHDIGKNLVKTILSNNGYTVHDLGKQVPLNTIIDKAEEVRADVIGLSALLVSTSKQMPMMVAELDKRGLRYPVIIGGAAINRGFGRRILHLDGERLYEPGVFYCKDAFEGLETCDQLIDPARRDPLVERIRDEARTFRQRELARESDGSAATAAPARARSDTRSDVPIPTPPFWGAQVVTGINPQAVYPHIDRTSLFKMSWQFRGVRDPKRWEELVRTELEPRLERSLREAQRDGWLELQAVYGYWPALAEGDEVVVFDPSDREREIGRFHFPRQAEQNRLCLADYVRPRQLAGAGERDLIALQVVTTGPGASELSNRLQAQGDYDDMLRIHGFATQMAEATAEYIHAHIRRELGLARDHGRRYSWGYPACPELADHETLFRIVPAERIGVSLTEGFQLVPEQSTAAIVMHHPQARYFAVYGSRFEESPGRGAPEEPGPPARQGPAASPAA